jgi:hypothetical protein
MFTQVRVGGRHRLLVRNLPPGPFNKGPPDAAPPAVSRATSRRCNGKERTKREWADMFARTGFELTGMHPTRSTYWVVEAAPAGPGAAADE